MQSTESTCVYNYRSCTSTGQLVPTPLQEKGPDFQADNTTCVPLQSQNKMILCGTLRHAYLECKSASTEDLIR